MSATVNDEVGPDGTFFIQPDVEGLRVARLR